MKRQKRRYLIRFCYDQRDVELRRSLGDRVHIDAARAQDGKQSPRDARCVPHRLTDDGDDREPFLHDEVVEDSDRALESELVFHATACPRESRRIDRKADRVLTRGLADEDYAHAVAGQRLKEPPRDSGHPHHAVSLQAQQRDVVDRRDPTHRPRGQWLRILAHQGPLAIQVERVADEEGNAALTCRMDRRRMDDLGAEVGKLHEFVVRELGQRERVRHQSGIGAHHAIDVRPDLEAIRGQVCAEKGSGVVGPAPPECRGFAAWVCGDEPRHDLQRIGSCEVPPESLGRRLPIDPGASECVVRDDQTACITRIGIQPRLAKHGSE